MEKKYKLNQKGIDFFTNLANEEGLIPTLDPEQPEEIYIHVDKIINGEYILNEDYDENFEGAIGDTDGLQYQLVGYPIFVHRNLIKEV